MGILDGSLVYQRGFKYTSKFGRNPTDVSAGFDIIYYTGTNRAF
jgi:hypothetical protein|tara:strand:+ start:3907 stop:4038 length:132 start_codon:yes stop_codon:yes gene_type:complete